MSRFSSNEIITSREIRVDRNKANYLRTKGIINRTAMCTTDQIVNIGEIPFGIANKINKYCNMEVYAESKWNLVQCMDNHELRRVFLAPKEITINDSIETNDVNVIGDITEDDTNTDIVSGNNDSDDIIGDMESSESDDEEANEVIDENIDTDDIEESVEDDNEDNNEEQDEEEEIITRSSSISSENSSDTDSVVAPPIRPNNNYNKYNNKQTKRHR